MAGRLTERHMETMRIPRRFWDATVREVPQPPRDKIVRVCRGIDEFLSRGHGLIFIGPNGVGKTSAAACICKAARVRGHSVLFVHVEHLRQAQISREMFDNDTSLIDRARHVDLLVIDDLGKEHRSESGFVERFLETFVRQRSADMKSTIFTTNMRVEQIKSVYKPSMVSVLLECAYPIAFPGKDRRVSGSREIAAWLESA